jgi:ABC-type nitrate/sulfonate/bicarbonate transport system substrate-binding protein
MNLIKNTLRSSVLTGVCFAVLALAGSGQSQAADKLRLAKVVPHPWTFIAADVAEEQGIWKKHNLDVEILGLGGSAKLAQALAAGSVDVGIGSGPGMGFIAKGAPELAVAAMAGQPLNMAIVVTKNSKLYPKGKGVKDLKGTKIGVSTPSSLTYFLTTRLAHEQGWASRASRPFPWAAFPPR